MKNIVFIGGDARTVFAAEYLKRLGNRCEVEPPNFEEAEISETMRESDAQTIAVLPHPYSVDGIIKGTTELTKAALLPLLPQGSILLGGGFDTDFCKATEELGIETYDYAKDEEYLLENAGLTAEGALGYILSESSKSISESDILILGSGRIASSLFELLELIGTDSVSIIMRNDEKRYNYIRKGISAFSFEELPLVIGGADVVINTVPHAVISNDLFVLVKPGAYFIELASQNGFDVKAAESFGINAQIKRGIPGKCAPKSAGGVLARAIDRTIKNLDGGSLR